MCTCTIYTAAAAFQEYFNEKSQKTTKQRQQGRSSMYLCTITTRWIQVFCTFSQAIFWQGTVKKLQATVDGCFPMPSFCNDIHTICVCVLKNIPIPAYIGTYLYYMYWNMYYSRSSIKAILAIPGLMKNSK